MTDVERPNGSTHHPLTPLSDENIAVAEAMGGNLATTPVSGASESMPRMSPAAAEEYVASLYATVLEHWLGVPSAPVLGEAFAPMTLIA